MTEVAPARVLVTGSRHCTEEQARATFEWLFVQNLEVIIVNGKCHLGGVDLVAERWADETPGARPENHPADWGSHGKAAGMIRNGEMVTLGARICLAFPARGSRGTWDCLRKAADAGIPGRVYPI